MDPKTLTHPLEELLNIEPATGPASDIERDYAIAEVTPATPLALTPPAAEKDEEDCEVDRKIDTVYKAAMQAFENQTAYAEIIEPRYAARNAEVAANYLTIALNAAAARARVKTDRRRANTFVPFSGGNKTTNNLIVADRNEILKMIQIDNKVEEIK